jgi:hypothetical protein
MTEGRRVLEVATWGTVAFAVTAVAAAVAPGLLWLPAQAVAIALFAVGCGAFVWSYAVAVSRSRTDEISVTGLYFLAGGSAPTPVRRRLMGALVAQLVVAVATAAVRPFTSLAFGVLVPVYGLGLAGLWAARHGTFPPRRARRDDARR